MSKNDFFSVGPFKETRDVLADFAFGIFYMQCFNDTLDEISKLEEEYEDALLIEDEITMAAKKKAIEYYEGMIMMAFDINENRQEQIGELYND